MNPSTEKSVASCIAVFAALAVVLCFALGGAQLALGAALGGALALGDYVFMWWAAARIFRGPQRGRAGLTFLLTMKFGLIGALLYFLIVVAGVEALGLALGLGALVLGIVVGALAHAPSRSLGEI
jgi:hypothetical protein